MNPEAPFILDLALIAVAVTIFFANAPLGMGFMVGAFVVRGIVRRARP